MPKRPTGNTLRALRRAVVAEHGAVCHLCGGDIDPTLPGTHDAGLVVDHVHPRSRGGADTLANLRPAHRACNLWKGARLLGELAPGQDAGTSRTW